MNRQSDQTTNLQQVLAADGTAGIGGGGPSHGLAFAASEVFVDLPGAMAVTPAAVGWTEGGSDTGYLVGNGAAGQGLRRRGRFGRREVTAGERCGWVHELRRPQQARRRRPSEWFRVWRVQCATFCGRKTPRRNKDAGRKYMHDWAIVGLMLSTTIVV